MMNFARAFLLRKRKTRKTPSLMWWKDLAKGKPMDRLICGDVGFGKTEVALRAAFIAALTGRQVAVIAPTTLLVRQHYRNFVSRFKGFPVKVGQLSRMVGAGEAKKVREGIADGQIDIVIGTHALLAKTIKFRGSGSRHCGRRTAFRR